MLDDLYPTRYPIHAFGSRCCTCDFPQCVSSDIAKALHPYAFRWERFSLQSEVTIPLLKAIVRRARIRTACTTIYTVPHTIINVHWLYVPFWLHGIVGADLRPDSNAGKEDLVRCSPVVDVVWSSVVEVHCSSCDFGPQFPGEVGIKSHCACFLLVYTPWALSSSILSLRIWGWGSTMIPFVFNECST
jgi:hypothetical protein